MNPSDPDYLPLVGVPLPGPWARRGACRGVEMTVFFSERGQNDLVARAKSICLRCPVRDECLEYALRHSIRYGIYGGKSERQRRSMRAARKEGGMTDEPMVLGRTYCSECGHPTWDHRDDEVPTLDPATFALVAVCVVSDCDCELWRSA